MQSGDSGVLCISLPGSQARADQEIIMADKGSCKEASTFCDHERC